MQTIECWDIQRWDGGSLHKHAFYLTDEIEKGFWLLRNKHDIAIKRTFVFYDTLEEVEQNTEAKIRERALAKLTAQEKAVLGIKE